MIDEDAFRNEPEWSAAIRRAFPAGSPPDSATWTDIDAMVRVLAPFMRGGLHHVMLPNGGGTDVLSITLAREQGCLEFARTPGAAILFRPASLRIEHFPSSPLNTFLLIDLEPIPASGVYEGDIEVYEDVVELPSGEYRNTDALESDHDGVDPDEPDHPLPEGHRVLTRYSSGRFMIVAKCSIWNRTQTTYDGRHNTMTVEEIRAWIAGAIRASSV